jgi:hypothetical protein
MTEAIFPPFHDLSRADFDTRKRHLLSEITRQPGQRAPHRSLPWASCSS